MKTKTKYLIYRYGVNSMNQSAEVMPVAIVEAIDGRAAIDTTWRIEKPGIGSAPSLSGNIIASAEVEPIYRWNNQRFTAVPKSRANRKDWEEVMNEDARLKHYGLKPKRQAEEEED